MQSNSHYARRALGYQTPALYLVWLVMAVMSYRLVIYGEVFVPITWPAGVTLLVMSVIQLRELCRAIRDTSRRGRQAAPAPRIFAVLLMALPLLCYSFVAFFEATAETGRFTVAAAFTGILIVGATIIAGNAIMFWTILPPRRPLIIQLSLVQASFAD